MIDNAASVRKSLSLQFKRDSNRRGERIRKELFAALKIQASVL
jgi:hypothetical protein